MSAPSPISGRFRGTVIGAVCAGAAIPAHGLAGGELPSSGPLIVLAGFGATIGLLTARSVMTLPRLITTLVVGQFLGHVLLSVMSGHSAAWTPTMAAHHAAAAVAVGLALWLAERLAVLVVTAAQRWLAITAPLPVALGVAAPHPHRGAAGLPQFLIGTRIPSRGPPLIAY